MHAQPYSEFIGISPRTASLIEALRIDPDEPKDAILLRALSPTFGAGPTKHSGSGSSAMLDIGEGAKLAVGEKVYLFLSQQAKKAKKPDGVAEVRQNGLAIDDKVIPQSKGSYIHPAMVAIQMKKGHRNEKGEIVSLSAWRQWYVVRGNALRRLLELKDPALAKKRERYDSGVTLEDLGL